MNEEDKIDEILKKYPNRVAVILEPTKNFNKGFDIKKKKYIINGDNTVGMFIFYLKQINSFKTHKSFYLFHYNTLINPALTFNQLKQQYKYEKVLVLTIDCEDAFG